MEEETVYYLCPTSLEIASLRWLRKQGCVWGELETRDRFRDKPRKKGEVKGDLGFEVEDMEPSEIAMGEVRRSPLSTS